MSGIEKFLNVLGFQVEWDDADQNQPLKQKTDIQDKIEKQKSRITANR